MLRHSTLRTWLQLFRAPNLFTVPGDPLAGFLLANSGFLDASLALPVLASLCFYAAGLLMNDLADEEEDRRERPQRPLPSGAARKQNVVIVMWTLNAFGFLAMAGTGSPPGMIAAAALIAAVWAYNRFTKRIPVLGALNMGACRGLSVMLGGFVGPMASFGAPLAIMPAAIVTCYIAAVTNLARHETRERVPILARLLPFVVGIGAAIGLGNYAAASPDMTPAIWIAAVFATVLFWLLLRLFPRPRPALPPLIGAHIRALLILQAAICYLGAAQGSGPVFAGILLLLWPVSRVVSKRFYAS